MQPVVHLGHEGVEMHPALPLHRRTVKEEIHDHGLAAADRPVEIEALGRLHLAPAKAQPVFPATHARRGLITFQRVMQRLEFFDRQRLLRIILDRALGAQGAVGRKRPLAHSPRL